MKTLLKTILRVLAVAVMFAWLLVNIVLIFGVPDGSLVFAVLVKLGGFVSVFAQLFVLAALKDHGLIMINF